MLVFEVLWEALSLPAMPARIAVDQHGVNEEERRHYRQQAEAEMARLGLGTLRDVNPKVSDLLELLASHSRGVGWRELLGHQRRAYAAARGSMAAWALLDNGLVSVSTVNPDRLINQILDVLPALPAGVGSAYSIPTDVYQRGVQIAVDGKGSTAQRQWLRNAGVHHHQADQLEVLTRTTFNTGSISVHRGKHGKTKLVGSLAYTDTQRGRYLLLQRPDRAGNSYTTIIPADTIVIRHHIAEIMQTTQQ